MRTHGGNSSRDQGGSDGALIDVPRLKDLVNPRALDILGKRMKIVGKHTAREVRIANTHRGEKTPSASWNTAKGVFCDKGDASYNGDIFTVVMRCDVVSFAEAVRIVAGEAGVAIPYLKGGYRKTAQRRRQAQIRWQRLPVLLPQARTAATGAAA
jgi:hypothetical protein